MEIIDGAETCGEHPVKTNIGVVQSNVKSKGILSERCSGHSEERSVKGVNDEEGKVEVKTD